MVLSRESPRYSGALGVTVVAGQWRRGSDLAAWAQAVSHRAGHLATPYHPHHLPCLDVNDEATEMLCFPSIRVQEIRGLFVVPILFFPISCCRSFGFFFLGNAMEQTHLDLVRCLGLPPSHHRQQHHDAQ